MKQINYLSALFGLVSAVPSNFINLSTRQAFTNMFPVETDTDRIGITPRMARDPDTGNLFFQYVAFGRGVFVEESRSRDVITFAMTEEAKAFGMLLTTNTIKPFNDVCQTMKIKISSTGMALIFEMLDNQTKRFEYQPETGAFVFSNLDSVTIEATNLDFVTIEATDCGERFCLWIHNLIPGGPGVRLLTLRIASLRGVTETNRAYYEFLTRDLGHSPFKPLAKLANLKLKTFYIDEEEVKQEHTLPPEIMEIIKEFWMSSPFVSTLAAKIRIHERWMPQVNRVADEAQAPAARVANSWCQLL